jgi:hypothetical protein
LKSLVLVLNGSSKYSFEYLSSLSDLEVLVIDSAAFDDSAFSALVALKKLQTLKLTAWKLTDKGLSALNVARWKALTTFHLEKTSKLKNPSLDVINRFETLTELKLTSCWAISEISRLAHLTRLRALCIISTLLFFNFVPLTSL